ncbi:siderophore ABC transporter substrate-binding protein [Dietzia lutea]|uniref:Iron ABC transporter substrate-binding protein n=1 Tax=Dietzia lutea TaxID=546160 RepID=A0A2S1R7W8_9ACTN|nr:ABC transporter substrate-binding protein [Dietzia lutea]AWH92397.1 iron ABC transporter substrate-binding protein [Dietzia lutea]
MTSTRLRIGAVLSALALGLTACGSDGDVENTAAEGGETTTIEIEDNNGIQTVTVPPQSVVATDNRTFETLSDWGVELKAAAVSLMPGTIAYKTDESIIDLGNHREPDLEAVVAAEPDLIINGQRFTQYHDDFARLVPDATIISLDPRDGQPLDAELKRQTTALGEIFGKEAEAEQLNADLDAAIERVKAAYSADDTVMGVITSGGNINYVTPGTGRTIGPLFDVLGLTPSLEVEEGSDNHQGDDISVEAIADSNPDIMIVMDRDGGTATGADDPGYRPASELLAESQALQGVTAVREDNIVYMPADTYTNESIQTYTEFLNTLADKLEAKN